MKYPKLRDGPSAIGESQIRQLAGLAMPFAQKFSFNSQSYKKNGFDEVHQQQGAPYLWGVYDVITDIGAQIFTAILSPEDGIAETVRYKANYNYGTTNADANSFKVFVGDNYVLRLFSDSAHPIDDPATKFWPSLARADALGREYLASEIGHENRSISYIDAATISGLGSFSHYFSLWACGWKDDTDRYHFGMNCRVYSGTHYLPVCFNASTGQYTMTQVAYPYYTGRDHNAYTAYTVGPNKVQALHTVVEDPALPQIPPYLATSNDNGATWSTAADVALTATLYVDTDARYLNDQLETLSRYAVIQYVGGGATMLFVPSAYVDGDETISTARYCPAIFLSVDGGSFSRVTWPADTWYCDRSGQPITPLTNKVGWTYMLTLRSAQYSTGIGCLHVPVFESGAWKLMFTQNYGASWQLSPAVPFEFIAPVTADFAGTIITPKTSTKVGRVIFSAPDYTNNKLRFYSSTGNFDEFKPVGTVVKAKGDLTYTGVDDTNYYFVNYGGKRFKPSVFPAFPGEFDKP